MKKLKIEIKHENGEFYKCACGGTFYVCMEDRKLSHTFPVCAKYEALIDGMGIGKRSVEIMLAPDDVDEKSN